MRAITYNSYGDIDKLQITELNSPKPGINDVIVKVIAISRAVKRFLVVLASKKRVLLVSSKDFFSRCSLPVHGMPNTTLIFRY